MNFLQKLATLVLSFSILLAFPTPARALPGASLTATASATLGDGGVPGETEEHVAPDSPRASVTEYQALCRQGKFTDAARYLELARNVDPKEGARLAERLDAVLRRRLILEPDDLSPASTGNTADGLPAGMDEVGKIVPRGDSTGDPVRIVRRIDADGTARWLFSKATVERIDKWYDALEDRWLRGELPESFFRPGPKGILVWQWCALPLIALLSLVIGHALGSLTRPLIHRAFHRRPNVANSGILDQLSGPVRFGWALAVASIAIPFLTLDRSADEFIWSVMRTLFHLAFFWAVVRAVDVGLRAAQTSPWGRSHPSGAGLLPLAGKVAKLALLAIAIVAILSEIGYPVASILAGLGVGGLAVALAAQKTVENLFGAASIGVDQPFRVGDFVSVDTISGTIEGLGLRSTRIRTVDRTLVTLPNGKLADMRIENFSMRDRFRFNAVFSLEPGTAGAVLQDVMRRIQEHIATMPTVMPSETDVTIKTFGKESVDLEITAAFGTTDGTQFNALRRDLLLKFDAIVRESGASFARFARAYVPNAPSPSPTVASAAGASAVVASATPAGADASPGRAR